MSGFNSFNNCSTNFVLTLIELIFHDTICVINPFNYTENDVPHPHVDVAFGFVILKYDPSISSTKSNLEPFKKLLKNLKKPYDNHSEMKDYQSPPLPSNKIYKTYCGT